MQLLSEFKKRFRLLLCVNDLGIKCAWIIPLEDKKDITITNAFQKILDEPGCKTKQDMGKLRQWVLQ